MDDSYEIAVVFNCAHDGVVGRQVSLDGWRMMSSRKHAYIISTPLNPTFIK